MCDSVRDSLLLTLDFEHSGIANTRLGFKAAEVVEQNDPDVESPHCVRFLIARFLPENGLIKGAGAVVG